MITIYTIAYNESLLMQFMIDHYRNRFPDCHIVVYDNYSTDNTVAIAESNGCEIRKFDTNNQIQDIKYLDVKNNCWKKADTDWVLICDVDELLEIKAQDVASEEALGATIIKFQGYNMINMEDNLDFVNMKYGLRNVDFDKYYLFNKKHIKEINYQPGCHSAFPTGKKIFSTNTYTAHHYKYINLDLFLSKCQMLSRRLSSENRKNHWGDHYSLSESKLRAIYQEVKDKAIKIIP